MRIFEFEFRRTMPAIETVACTMFSLYHQRRTTLGANTQRYPVVAVTDHMIEQALFPHLEKDIVH